MAIDYYSKGVAQLEKGIAYNIRREGQSRCNRRKQKNNNNKKRARQVFMVGRRKGLKIQGEKVLLLSFSFNC